MSKAFGNFKNLQVLYSGISYMHDIRMAKWEMLTVFYMMLFLDIKVVNIFSILFMLLESGALLQNLLVSLKVQVLYSRL